MKSKGTLSLEIEIISRPDLASSGWMDCVETSQHPPPKQAGRADHSTTQDIPIPKDIIIFISGRSHLHLPVRPAQVFQLQLAGSVKRRLKNRDLIAHERNLPLSFCSCSCEKVQCLRISSWYGPRRYGKLTMEIEHPKTETHPDTPGLIPRRRLFPTLP